MGLFKPAWMYDGDYRSGGNWKRKQDKAIAAVDKMSDPAQLKEVALHAPNSHVAVAACLRIKDERSLADVAIGAQSHYASSFAVTKIEDPALLKRIALEAKYDKGGREAAAKITDQRVLAEIVHHAKDHSARAVAREKIVDASIIMERLRSGDITFLTLVDRIDDQSDLREALFDLFDSEAIALYADSGSREKQALVDALASAVEKLKGEADIDQVLSSFGKGLLVGAEVKPVRKAAELRKAALQAERVSGYVVLVCDTCGDIICYEESVDTQDPNWSTSAWFHCKCGLVSGGPRRNGAYDKPTHAKIAVSAEQTWGKVVHLCPTCLRLVANSPHGRKIPNCTCGKPPETSAIVRYKPAVW